VRCVRSVDLEHFLSLAMILVPGLDPLAWIAWSLALNTMSLITLFCKSQDDDVPVLQGWLHILTSTCSVDS